MFAADIAQAAADGRLIVYPPEITRSDVWAFWLGDVDVTDRVTALIDAGRLVGPWDALEVAR